MHICPNCGEPVGEDPVFGFDHELACAHGFDSRDPEREELEDLMESNGTRYPGHGEPGSYRRGGIPGPW